MANHSGGQKGMTIKRSRLSHTRGAGDIADSTRNRLLPEKVEMLLFLNKNLILLNFDY